jgi:hypothetical protein
MVIQSQLSRSKMFDKLFGSGAAVQHHLSSPLLQERLEYLQHCADQGYSLRSFLRYAESRGWCTRGLAALVASPRVYQHENLPRGPSWSDVQRLVGHHRGIPAQGYSGSRHFASPGRLRPALRRSAGPGVGRFRLGKGLAFRLAHQGAKANLIPSPPPSAKPSSAISEKRALGLRIEKSF